MLLGGFDLEQLAAVVVVDLERRVLDLEAVVEHALDLATAFVAVAVGGDEHVGAQRREARRDLPDMEVVHLDDARL